LERLWSPWRLTYVARTEEPEGCVFCEALTSRDAEPLVLFRGPSCFVILNLFPYNNGHLLIAPRRHTATLASLTDDELVELARLTQRAERALTEAYEPQGLNVGLNLGRPAGAGIADHLHVHVLPRWNGDTNFMSVVGKTRVLPEALAQTAARLRPVFERLARPAGDERRGA
jgi:ATP adenylyltransferase